MPIVNAEDPLNPHAFIDADHPERGLFIAKAGMDEKAVAAEWDAVLNPTSERQASDAEKAATDEHDRRQKARDDLKDQMRGLLAELLDERKASKT